MTVLDRAFPFPADELVQIVELERADARRLAERLQKSRGAGMLVGEQTVMPSETRMAEDARTLLGPVRAFAGYAARGVDQVRQALRDAGIG